MVDHPKVALACVGVVGCVGGFVLQTLPYLQFCALVISIVASAFAIFRPRK